MMNKKLCQLALEKLIEAVESARPKLTDSTLPPLDVCRVALEGIVAKRGKNVIRRTAPVFREHPLGSILHRCIAFHRSNGSLYGLFGTQDDVSLLLRASGRDPSSYGSYWTNDKSLLFEHARLVAGIDDLYDQMDTLALVLLQGQSSAAQAWQKALSQ